jgi:hypothetical protein
MRACAWRGEAIHDVTMQGRRLQISLTGRRALELCENLLAPYALRLVCQQAISKFLIASDTRAQDWVTHLNARKKPRRPATHASFSAYRCVARR